MVKLAVAVVLSLLAGAPAAPAGGAYLRGRAGRSLAPSMEQQETTGKVNWYEVDYGENQHPENLEVDDDHTFIMSIKPNAENVKVTSKEMYTGGAFHVSMKSAAVMPGVVTAVYLASGEGRTGDETLGTQDEIDFEFKGNMPNMVQTNVFLNGQEHLELLDVGDDTSANEHVYGVEWDDTAVRFLLDGEVKREVVLDRPLQPLKLYMSVWTTTGTGRLSIGKCSEGLCGKIGGWPGLKQWAGETNWEVVGGTTAAATINVLELPNTTSAVGGGLIGDPN